MAATLSSSHEEGTLRNLASRCNLIPNLEVNDAPSEIQIMVEFLCNHDLNIPLTKQAQVPISLIQCAYHTARYFKEEDCVEFNADAKNSMKVDKSKFLVAIGFPDLPKEERNIEEPTKDELFDMLEKMNYLGGRLEKIPDFLKRKLPAVWQYLCHILLRCLSGKAAGSHHLSRGYLSILYGLYYDMDVDIGDILWKDFVTYIEPKKAEIRHGRFWGLILKLCYKELKLEMPKGELAVFRTLNQFPVPDQSCFGVVNPIPEEMLKYIPTTSTVLSSYLKAMDQSKPAEPSPDTLSGEGNTKRQQEIALGTTTSVTGTLKRKHESSQQGDVKGRKATEESLKLIEEERQKKLEQEEFKRKAFEESEKRKNEEKYLEKKRKIRKKKKTDEGQEESEKRKNEEKYLEKEREIGKKKKADKGQGENEKYLEKKREIGEKKKTDKGQGGTEEDVLKVNFAEGAKHVAFEDDSSAESAKKRKEIKDSQGTPSEGLSKTRKQGSKYVSKKKFKQMEKTLNEVLEFVRHIPTAADVYTPRADFTKLLDTLEERHGEDINRFSTQNSELRKQNIVLHSVVVKLLKSLENLAKPPPEPSHSLEVLSVLKSMQTTMEDLPKQLSSEPLKKHFDEAFAKLFALMTDPKVLGQEKRGEEGSSREPIVISKEPSATPSTIFGEAKENGGEKVVVKKVQKRPSPPSKQIEEPEMTPDTERPEGGRRSSLRLKMRRMLKTAV